MSVLGERKETMKRKSAVLTAAVGVLGWMLFYPDLARATQGHGGIEGVYVHQLAHIFFLISMGGLIYWLRERGLARQSGWRLIQFSALFFILWNLDTLLVHALDDQFNLLQVQRIGKWQILLTDRFDSNFLKVVYYIAKLDHLLCVPALLFLYAGLRRLLKDNAPEIQTSER